ncbi:hypothetical protein FRX31_028474 [Thalictrum thalictroides]|uniref:AT-hook motif nuclear-localized protein n=1 Tax=Thalictrum thalictroides TaxID=46969 RepID=A0A7J6VA59_THATH|nr:hypothetical protein FRX31_028474 [Thalictrum thalictroides]
MFCILSGSGDLSFVEIHNQSINEVMTYEGNLRVLSLSGIFQQSGSGGQLDVSRALTVSFSRNDHQIFGGVVARRLLAASQVLVVLGSFVIENKKRSKSNRSEHSSVPSESSSSQGHSAREHN